MDVKDWARLVERDVPAETVPVEGRRSTATTRAKAPRRGVDGTTKPKTPNRAGSKRKGRLPRPDLPAADKPSRGPWTIEVDWLGRPMTVNDERTGAWDPATARAVSSDKRDWQAAFVAAVRHVGIPPQSRVFVAVQVYYPNNVVPDPDAFGPTHKSVHDALVVSGVLPNDRRRNLPFGYYPLPPLTDGECPRVVAVIFPLPAD